MTRLRAMNISHISSWFLLRLFLLLWTFCLCTDAGQSNNFHRNSFSGDQAARSFYPANYKRFRRGYGAVDEPQDSSFPNFSGTQDNSFATFPGTFRKGSGARKGGSKSFASSRGFGGFGGPDAFLNSAENDAAEEQQPPVQFGGGSGGFSSFGGSSSWSSSSSKGRSKGGGIKNAAKASVAQPTSINFGQDPSIFGGSSGSKYPFGSSSSFPNSGGSFGGSPQGFGNTNQGSIFGSYGGSQGRGSFSSGNTKTFSGSLHSVAGGDPFKNSGGATFNQEGGFSKINSKSFPTSGSTSSGSGISFGNLLSGKIEDLSGGKVLGPLKNFPDLGSFDLNALINQLEPTISTKKPTRVISDEDKNKIFSGEPAEEGEKLEDAETFYPLVFPGEKEGTKTHTKSPSKKNLKTCDDVPEAPVNAAIKCTPYSGCIIDCNPNYRTTRGDSRLYLKCTDGEWNIIGQEDSVIPNCEPICDPPCQNSGICLAPNTCICPDDWTGTHCEKQKEMQLDKCLDKPPSPMNSKIFCGPEECIAKCIEGYRFEDGSTKVTFVCEKGKWTMKKSQLSRVPSCQAICDPACTNEGICLAPNLCECTSNYRGPLCQYPISNCDPKALNFNGGYNCSGENMDFGCKLWCPAGIGFSFPEAEFYKCDYATGNWSPSPIPQCDYTFLDGSAETFHHSRIVSFASSFQPSSGTCFTWSGSHYKSFDGKVYSFESGCPYTFLQDATLGTFSVNLIPEEGCEGPKCQKALKLFTEGDQFLLQNSGNWQPVLTYRDTSLAIPGQMNGLVTERVAHYVVIKLAGIGLTLKWDLKSFIIAEVSELLWNRTSGLCGRLDGSVNNDWGYSDGSSEASLSAFLKAWQATTVGEPCSEPPLTSASCSKDEEFKAQSFCSKMSDDPRFEICRSIVNVEPYVKACEWDYCSCDDLRPESCSCDSFAAFFRECTNKGGAVEGGWRSEDLCPLKCDGGLEYKSCMPAIQPRCGQAAETTKPEFCVEGCDCSAGFVLSTEGQCIDPSECPCTYHNKTYSSGDTIPNDCNSCACVSGEWVCTEVKCGSRCAAVGDPHYTTFDGRKFDFMGKCSYYMVRGGDFSIEAENTACAGAISEAQYQCCASRCHDNSTCAAKQLFLHLLRRMVSEQILILHMLGKASTPVTASSDVCEHTNVKM